MKKIILLLTLLISAILFTSCMTIEMVPVSEHSEFPADGSKYKILGRVIVDTDQNHSGYNLLIDAAKRKYPEADDVVNIIVDARKTTHTFFWFFDDVRYTYTISGIAIDYLDN